MSNDRKKPQGGLKRKRVEQSNAEFFNRLVLENQEKIYTLFRRMVRTHDEADDLTQETFIKVYKNLSKFRYESTPFTWIYRIAVNTGLNYLRRQKARQYIGLDAVTLKSDTTEKKASELSSGFLRNALNKLSPRQRMVIILRSYQGLAFKDIGRLMDSTENAAKVNYSHALKNLRKTLEQMGISYDTL
jgi:RNA polymerase sigma factor (sigma-70 family)